MPFLLTGFVDGQAKYPAQVFRAALGAVSTGTTGVNDPAALKVTPLSIPGPQVAVSPGGAQVISPWQTAFREVYTVALDSTVTVAVPPNNTAAPVSYEVYVRVYDPNVSGEVDSPPTVEVSSALPAGKPVLWLATITLPASTATVQAGYITDRRQLASPRTRSGVELWTPSASTPQVLSAVWPSLAQWPAWSVALQVPTWANTLTVSGSVSSAFTTGTAGTSQSVYLSPAFGGAVSPATWQSKTVVPSPSTFLAPFAARFTVTQAQRGTNQPVAVYGAKLSSAGAGVQATDWTTITLNWMFSEQLV